MKLRTILIALTIAAMATTTQAYVQALHRKISAYAFDRAVGEADFMKRFGFEPISSVMRNDLQYGADHEDDIPNSVNHFFDFENRAPLTERLQIICDPVGERADRWALNDSFFNPNGLAGAHASLYRAVASATEGDREFWAGQLFTRLGHVIHLVQDMAQPEHTRNDQHLTGFSFGDTAPSIYENWTRDNLVAPNFLPDGTPVESFFVGYPTISSRPYSAYFGDDRSGLAAYSARYHVTQDTNYDDTSPITHCFTHPEPVQSIARQRVETRIINVVDNPLFGTTRQVSVPETIYALTDMIDYATGFHDGDGYHTVESSLDHETQRYDENVRVFSLDEPSYQIRAGNLLPKAVGYSASLLEHFFRGKLTTFFTLDDNNNYKITLHSGVDVMTNATVEILRNGDDDALAPLAPPTLMSSLGFLDDLPVSVPSVDTNHNQPIYMHDMRVVAKGKLGDEDDAVIVQIIPRRHKLRIEVTYDTGIGYDQLGLQALKLGTGFEDCAYCSTMTFAPTSITYYARNIPFSDAKKWPFNGEMDVTVGALDSEEFFVDVVGAAHFFQTSHRTATITVYRDDRQTAQRTVDYTGSLREWVSFKGDGTLTMVQSFSN